VGGFTELFKNRVVIPFTGDYKMFRHVIHHELVHAVMNDMFFGGSFQNIISNNISINFPIWFNEGLAEYLSLDWDTNTDMYIRDAATSEYLPDIQQLDNYAAYRGGQSVFHYIAKKYGEEKIGDLIQKIRNRGSLSEGIQTSLGFNLEELNDHWKKDIKKEYWPEIAIRKDPDEFSKRLTDHRKDGGFFNSSPAISPQGDKIAFISNRDLYFDVYIMSATDGKIIKRLVKGNRTVDFEQLNILTPGICWSPDETKIALSAKSGGFDVVYIIDVESEDINPLPLKYDEISSVTWSPDGKYLAFCGGNASQSDIYTYNIETGEVKNLTDDIFLDIQPSWSPDASKIFFISDRGKIVNDSTLPNNFLIYNHNYSKRDVYSINIKNNEITRLTDLPPYSEASYPVCSSDGKEILFISDMNGINNIYRKRIELTNKDSVKSICDIKDEPITNSLNGLYQISISKDGKKLAFSSMYQSAYDIFLLNDPFEIKIDKQTLEPTPFISKLIKKSNPVQVKDSTGKKDSSAIGTFKRTSEDTSKIVNSKQDSLELKFHTEQLTDTLKTDTVKKDFSRFVFKQNNFIKADTSGLPINKDLVVTDNLDSAGNFKVNKYKINFSPDIIYANAGYNTIFGLQGTTVFSFSDVLGNHRIVAETSLQIDLKNSNYGLAYYYLPSRWSFGVEAFHTAQFFYLTRGIYSDLFRFGDYGGVLSASYPLNQFYRLETGLSLLYVTQENLDDPTEPMQNATYLIPAISFIHDNTIFGYTAPIDGTRYRFDIYGNPIVQRKEYGFYSFLGDYRSYDKFFTDYSFAFRLSGGFSYGVNPQRFFLGGVDNWINTRFATGNVPIQSTTDFAFLTLALPMRGFDFGQEVGTRYLLTNSELRFPLIRYLLTGGLPLFFRDVLGALFVDAGTAWNYDKQLQLFTRDENGKVITNDLLIGTGFGIRIFALGFLVKFDEAWAFTWHRFAIPVFYFSLGGDF
jgi:Tol biopolymer transport system component